MALFNQVSNEHVRKIAQMNEKISKITPDTGHDTIKKRSHRSLILSVSEQIICHVLVAGHWKKLFFLASVLKTQSAPRDPRKSSRGKSR